MEKVSTRRGEGKSKLFGETVCRFVMIKREKNWAEISGSTWRLAVEKKVARHLRPCYGICKLCM